MAVSASQEAAFQNATFGLTMEDFQFTALLILFGLIYLWAGWVMISQWKAWSRRQINFYDLLVRSVRCVLVTIFASFLLIS